MVRLFLIAPIYNSSLHICLCRQCKSNVRQIWWSCRRPRSATKDWMGRFECCGIEFAPWTRRGRLLLNWQDFRCVFSPPVQIYITFFTFSYKLYVSQVEQSKMHLNQENNVNPSPTTQDDILHKRCTLHPHIISQHCFIKMLMGQ